MSGIGVVSDDKRHARTLSLWYARARFFTDFSSWVAFVSRGLAGTHGVGDDCCLCLCVYVCLKMCVCFWYVYVCRLLLRVWRCF